MRIHLLKWALRGIVVSVLASPYAHAACCYFSAKNSDVLQPAQKVFITWNPQTQIESFTVQPKFEVNAADFGMVIPTPPAMPIMPPPIIIPGMPPIMPPNCCGSIKGKSLDCGKPRLRMIV